MSQYGALINEHMLKIERLLPGPIERVWEYLTDDTKRSLWFAWGPMDDFGSGKVEYRFDHSKLSSEHDPIPEKYRGLDGRMTSVAEVKEYSPPNKLVILWEGGEVTFSLTQEGEKVRLILTHKNLKKEKDQRVGTMAGWHTHLDILGDRLNHKEPKGFWAVHMKLEREYAERMG